MRGSEPGLLRSLTGAAAASGLALAGLVMTSAPASAAACSGTSGVTVVVDTGESVSTRCAAGDPASALKALTAAGFSVTYPQQYPGSVVCRIDGYPGVRPVRPHAPGGRLLGLLPCHAWRRLDLQLERGLQLRPSPRNGRRVPFRRGSAAARRPTRTDRHERSRGHDHEAATHVGAPDDDVRT